MLSQRLSDDESYTGRIDNTLMQVGIIVVHLYHNVWIEIGAADRQAGFFRIHERVGTHRPCS